MTERLRKEFEEWLERAYWIAPKWDYEERKYSSFEIGLAYRAWEASRAAMPEPGADIEFLDVVKVWRTGEYIGIFEAQIIAGCKKTGVIGTVALENIRPAKSEAEKERQAVIREMMETVCKGTPWTLSADAAAKLYDAGYRKIVAKK